MRFNDNNHVLNLPDAFNKLSTSNNYKILEVERQAVNENRSDAEEVDTTNDIEQAYGKTLDYYGETVGQPRGLATDAQYLIMIKSKIRQNLSNATYPSVVAAVCSTFNCDPSEFLIEEDESPCTVNIILLPLAVIVHAGLTAAQAMQIIKRLLPICISVDNYLFEGTFEFSSSESEYDADAGFCDVEGGTLGGYFGITGGDANEPILPIY